MTDHNAPSLGGNQPNAPRLGKRSSIPHLLHLIDEAPDHIQQRAINALGTVGTAHPSTADDIVPVLIDKLNTDSWQMVRVAAAYRLGEIGRVLAEQPLLTQIAKALMGQVANRDVIYTVRLVSAFVLGEITPHLEDEILRERIALTLISTLNQAHVAVQEEAVHSLTHIADVSSPAMRARIVEAITGTLRNPHSELVMAAVYALGQIGAATTRPALTRLRSDTRQPAISKYSRQFQLYGGRTIGEVATNALKTIDERTGDDAS